MLGILLRLLGIGAIGAVENHNLNKKIKEIDDDPRSNIKSDAWYKANNTTPEEQRRLRLQKINLYNAKNARNKQNL